MEAFTGAMHLLMPSNVLTNIILRRITKTDRDSRESRRDHCGQHRPVREMVKKMASLREGDGSLLDNCIMMWGSGLEDGDKHSRANLPFIIAGKGGGTINTGRFLPDTKGNQGDLLTTILACAGIPLDRPIGIATKQIQEMSQNL